MYTYNLVSRCNFNTLKTVANKKAYTYNLVSRCNFNTLKAIANNKASMPSSLRGSRT